MRKTIFIFSLLVFALLLLFQVSKYSIMAGNLRYEIIIAIVAIVFFVIGVYLNRKSLQKHKLPLPTNELDHQKIKSLELSAREYEVLVEIAKGLSNKEIGEKLFLSESTIKTHVSNLLVKLNAIRRTQAIRIAKELRII